MWEAKYLKRKEKEKAKRKPLETEASITIDQWLKMPCLAANAHHRVPAATPIEILRISSRCGESN